MRVDLCVFAAVVLLPAIAANLVPFKNNECGEKSEALECYISTINFNRCYCIERVNAVRLTSIIWKEKIK